MKLTSFFLVIFIMVVPALFFWPREEWFSPTLTNKVSYAVVFFGVVLSYATIRNLARFPGERSSLSVIPLCAIWFAVGMVAIVAFRLPYSLYYILSAFLFTIVAFFVGAIHQQRHIQKMAYVKVDGMDILPNPANIHWIELTKPILPDSEISAVVVNLYAHDLDDIWQKFLAECTLAGMPVYNIRQVNESLTGRVKIRHIYENDLGSLLPSPTYLNIKRIVDIGIVLITSPISVPLMLLTALAIRLESSGNVLFTQKRVGQNGHEFTIYKFRSMCIDSEKQGAKFATTGDMRITKVGRFIRKTRLDELPQFWNILKGEMSLIGPRPEQKFFVEQFEQSIPFYNYRHIVKPGISGWAQVMQGYAANADETQIKVEYDFYYIKHFSFSLDILIFFKTIHTMLTGFGAR